MLEHYYPSIAQALLTEQCNVARLRTNATYVLTQSMAKDQGNLTFRNARARIRMSALGMFGSGVEVTS